MACAGSAATSNLPHAQVRCASGGHDSLRSQWSHEEFDGGELTASDIAFKGQSRRPTCFYQADLSDLSPRLAGAIGWAVRDVPPAARIQFAPEFV